MLLAEGSAEVASWASLVGSATSAGFAAAVGWYLLTKALPGMLEKFGASLKEQQDKFDRALAEQRGDGKAGLEVVIKHCERESERQGQRLDGFGKSLTDYGEIMEEVRDALREFNAWRGRSRRRPQPPPAGGGASQP